MQLDRIRITLEEAIGLDVPNEWLTARILDIDFSTASEHGTSINPARRERNFRIASLMFTICCSISYTARKVKVSKAIG
jgi:hypothetical protein